MVKFFSCVVPDPLQWFFHLTDFNRMDAYQVSTVDVPESPIASGARDLCNSSGVTPCIIMKNDGVLYHQVSSFSPETMQLRSLRQSERTTARDPVQHKR